MVDNSKSLSNKEKLDDAESKIISVLQSFAILSVIAAHVNTLNDVTSIHKIITSFWGAFGCVGVAIFFLLGGFLYNRKASDTAAFWNKKLHGLIIPWLVCSFITYGIKVITTNQFGILDYLKWVFGFGTWYYYSTVYIVFLALFKLLMKSDMLLYVVMGLNILSLGISTFNKEWLNFLFLTPYLNILNWIGFFALGIIIRKYRLDRKIMRSRGPLVMGIVIAIIAFRLMQAFDKRGYFNVFGLVFELATAVVLLYVARGVCRFKFFERFAEIGSYAYCIYLLHMPIVQPICARLPDMLIFDIIKPMFGFVIMVFLVCIAKSVCAFLPFGERICKIVGIRFR